MKKTFKSVEVIKLLLKEMGINNDDTEVLATWRIKTNPEDNSIEITQKTNE